MDVVEFVEQEVGWNFSVKDISRALVCLRSNVTHLLNAVLKQVKRLDVEPTKRRRFANLGEVSNVKLSEAKHNPLKCAGLLLHHIDGELLVAVGAKVKTCSMMHLKGVLRLVCDFVYDLGLQLETLGDF